MAESPNAAPRIWVVTDGRPGNENPALGLAEALARRGAGAFAGAAIEVKRIAPKPAAARLPARVWAALGAREGGWPFSGLTDRGAALARPWPGLAIGAGRRSAPLVAALRALSGGATQAAQILDPQMPLDRFDAVLAPRHDRLRGPNVIATIGALTRITRDSLAEAAKSAPDPLRGPGRPRIAALLGGPSGAARIGAPEFAALGRWLAARAAEGAQVWVTPSRRTPPAALAALAQALGGRGWIWDPADAAPNPYAAMLALADEIVVTGDSVNMASEAAATGKPLRIAPAAKLSPKLAAFHAALRDCAAAAPLDAPPPAGGFRPLRETDAAAAQSQTLLARGAS